MSSTSPNPRQSTALTPNACWVLSVLAALAPVAMGVEWKAWLWWASLMAPCAGALSALGSRPWLRGLGVLAWCGAWAGLASDLGAGVLLGGLGGLLGLLSMGWALGVWLGRSGAGKQSLAGALAALSLSLFLTALPAGFWLFRDPPWSPAVAAFLLDCSPAALLLESAGVDFLRLPAIYGPVGADSMDPNLRLAWGSLAGWGVCVLGLSLSMAEFAWRRRKLVPQRNP